jgi:hypothetical protein
MILNNKKGQAGPLGEDLILLIILVLCIAAILVTLNNLFTRYISKSNQLDMYRTALVLGDKISTEWAYTDPSGLAHSRVLDRDKICTNCQSHLSGYTLYYRVMNLKIKTLLCSCGSSFPPIDPTDDTTSIIKLPVAIRFSKEEVHPGTLEIAIWR